MQYIIKKMEKVTWTAKLKEDKKSEYIKRHNEIWPQMKEVLNEAGIVNYTIWERNGRLFGYYECKYGKKHAEEVQANSPVVDKWNEYMKDVMDMDFDETTGVSPSLEMVFSFNLI